MFLNLRSIFLTQSTSMQIHNERLWFLSSLKLKVSEWVVSLQLPVWQLKLGLLSCSFSYSIFQSLGRKITTHSIIYHSPKDMVYNSTLTLQNYMCIQFKMIIECVSVASNWNPMYHVKIFHVAEKEFLEGFRFFQSSNIHTFGNMSKK